MSRRRLAILVLAYLLVVAGLFLTQSHEPPPPKNDATNQRATAEQRSPENTPIVQPHDSAADAEEKPKPDTKDRNEKWYENWNRSDKIAAAATFAGFLQFLALAITIGVLISTARRQLRAYIFPESVGLWDGTTLQPPQPHRANIPGIVLSWKNTGQTPARDVVSWAQIAVIETMHEDRLLVVPTLEQKFASVLGTNGVNTKSLWFDRVLTPNEITDIASGSRAIYLYGRIEYRDIFRKRRWSNFRLRYVGHFPAPPETIVFSTSERGNESK